MSTDSPRYRSSFSPLLDSRTPLASWGVLLPTASSAGPTPSATPPPQEEVGCKHTFTDVSILRKINWGAQGNQPQNVHISLFTKTFLVITSSL